MLSRSASLAGSAVEREDDKRGRGVSYWRIEGVNALVLVYPIGAGRDADLLQVVHQLVHDDVDAAVMTIPLSFSLLCLGDRREDLRDVRDERCKTMRRIAIARGASCQTAARVISPNFKCRNFMFAGLVVLSKNKKFESAQVVPF